MKTQLARQLIIDPGRSRRLERGDSRIRIAKMADKKTMADKKMVNTSMLRSIAVAAGLALFVAGRCWAQSMTTTEQGLVGGGVLGAGTGAIVGAAVHHPVKGALIGGGVGLVAGGVVGHELQTQDERQYRLQKEVSAQQRQIDSQRREINELKQSEDTE